MIWIGMGNVQLSSSRLSFNYTLLSVVCKEEVLTGSRFDKMD